MGLRFRRATVAAIGALFLLLFDSSFAAANAGPTEPNTYELSRGASVDRSVSYVDKAFASASAAPAPCVAAHLDPRGVITQTIHVRNSCAAQQRVKIIVAFGFDSPCFILEPGASVAHAMDISLQRAYFDGIESC
jgi:hypothetical protein